MADMVETTIAKMTPSPQEKTMGQTLPGRTQVITIESPEVF
jgi:hypothetical protein